MTSRAITRCDRIEGDIFGLAKEMGYAFSYVHLERGHRFRRRDSVVSIYRVYKVKDGAKADSMVTKDYEVVGAPDCYIIEASVDIKQGNDPAEVRRATQDLLRIKNELGSYVDLRVVRDELR